MPHLPNSTILVVGGQILTTGDFVFEADQGSLDQIIDDFGPPIINFISPSIIMEGERIEIIMSGNRTYDPLTLTISGDDIAVEDVHVDNDGQITARIEVAANAATSADDQRSIIVTTLPGQSDSDNNPIHQTGTFTNKLRVYFSPPTITNVNYHDGAEYNKVNQGDTITATIDGTKFYHQNWEANPADNQQMEINLMNDFAGQGITYVADSLTVISDTQATAQFQVAENAARTSHDIKVSTYSGESNTLADNLTIYYSAPTITSLTETPGGANFAGGSIVANGTPKTLKITGTRLEGVDSADRIKVGQIDGNGNFLLSAPKEDGTGNVTLAEFCTISNVTLNAADTSGAGQHTVDFALTVSESIGSDLSNIALEVTALDAAGSLTAVTSAFAIDALEPSLTSISVAGRPAGDDKSMYDGLGAQTVTVTGSNLHGDLRSLEIGTFDQENVWTAASNISVSGAQKNSATEAQMTVTVDSTTPIGVYDVRLVTEGGTASSAAVTAAKLEVIYGAPTLSADAADNHLTLDKPESGWSDTRTFNITGANFMNIFDGATALRATDAGFVDYYQNGDTMTVSLAATSDSDGDGSPDVNIAQSLRNVSLKAVSATSAELTLEVSAAASLGLVDLEVTTRSGATGSLAGVIDIIPGDPSFTSLVPDLVMEGSGDLVLTLSGANFFPQGDGNPAGSTLLGIKDPYNPNFTDCDFGTQGQTNQSVFFRRVHDFASPVGGELVDVAIDPNGAFEIAKLTDTYNQQEMYGKMAGVNNGSQNPDSAWGSSHADLTADEWIVVRVKSGEAVGTYSDTLTASTEASPSQSVSLDVEIVTDAQELINTAMGVAVQVQASLPAAQAGDPGALGFVNAMRNALAGMSAAMTQFIADHGPSGSNTMSGGEVTDMTNAIALADTLVADIDAL